MLGVFEVEIRIDIREAKQRSKDDLKSAFPKVFLIIIIMHHRF